MKKAPKQNIKDQTATDYWLEKGDYVNFDYVTLGWNVPIEKVQKLKKYVRPCVWHLQSTTCNHFRLFGTFTYD